MDLTLTPEVLDLLEQVRVAVKNGGLPDLSEAERLMQQARELINSRIIPDDLEEAG